MKANTRLKYPPVSSTSFYQLLAAINLVPARLLDDQPRLLMQRYQLRLHQMMVVDVQGEVRGILLVGFEANTGLCNAQWYEMRYRRPHLKPGRPRKIPPANDEVTAYWSSVSEIRLPDGLLAEFCTECQARFFVPLTRFMLPRGYSADTIIPAIKFSQFDPIVEIASQPGSTIQLTDERAEVTIEQWRIRALRWIDRHNRHLAREVVDEEWKQIAAQLLSAAAVKKWQHWSIRDKRRTAWINDEQLRAFYRDHPRYLGQIAPICRRVKVLRLEKKPDVAGKAG